MQWNVIVSLIFCNRLSGFVKFYLFNRDNSCYWTSILQKILDVNIVDHSELLTLSYKNFAIKKYKNKNKNNIDRIKLIVTVDGAINVALGKPQHSVSLTDRMEG